MRAVVLSLALLVQSGTPAGIDSVHAFLEAWKVAWESRQIDRYMGHYSPAFRGAGKDREAWGQHKQEVFARAGDISVTLENVSIELRGEKAAVRFLQRYRSDRYADNDWKALVLERADGAWRIASEESIAEEGGPGPGSALEAPPVPSPPVPTPTPRPLDARARRDLYERFLQLRNAALACSRPNDRKFPRPARPVTGPWCQRFHPQGGGDCQFYADCARYEEEVYRFVIEQAQLPDIATQVRRCGNVDVPDLELVEVYLTSRCPRFYP